MIITRIWINSLVHRYQCIIILLIVDENIVCYLAFWALNCMKKQFYLQYFPAGLLNDSFYSLLNKIKKTFSDFYSPIDNPLTSTVDNTTSITNFSQNQLFRGKIIACLWSKLRSISTSIWVKLDRIFFWYFFMKGQLHPFHNPHANQWKRTFWLWTCDFNYVQTRSLWKYEQPSDAPLQRSEFTTSFFLQLNLPMCAWTFFERIELPMIQNIDGLYRYWEGYFWQR